jgi:hypothetical protein
MAAVELADATLANNSALPPSSNPTATTEMNMPGMAMGPIGPEVSFPYGFPKPGLYRIFVQVKYNGRVETGVFDVEAK